MEDKFYCQWCGKEITGKGRRNKKFCCRACYNENHKLEHYRLYLADNSIAWGIQNMQQCKKDFLEEEEPLLYVTTYQGDNFRFVQGAVDFDVHEKCSEIDSYMLWFGGIAKTDTYLTILQVS